MTIADRIKHARIRRGWTQARLAGELGVSTQAISQWENGKTTPSGDRAFLLAKALEADYRWLMLGKEEGEAVFGIRNRQLISLITKYDVLRYSFSEPSAEFEVDPDAIELTTTFALKGLGFGIELDSDIAADIKSGDILIFDTGVEPNRGDYLVATLLNGMIWDVVVGQLDEHDRVSGYPVLASMNNKLKGEKLAAALSGESPTATLIATLVERRTFYRT